MDYRALEKFISEGNFEKFCEMLSKMPKTEYPEIMLVPKLGSMSDSNQDSGIYHHLIDKKVAPSKALELSSSGNLSEALEKLNVSGK